LPGRIRRISFPCRCRRPHRSLVSVSANAYRTDGPWALALAAGLTGSLNWNIEASGYWYDFTAAASTFERRFAGRMETGHDGSSDPAMALSLSI